MKKTIFTAILISILVLTGCASSESSQVFDFSKNLLPGEINIDKANDLGYELKDDEIIIEEDLITGIIQMSFSLEKDAESVNAYLAILNPIYRDHNELLSKEYDNAYLEHEEYKTSEYEITVIQEDNNVLWINEFNEGVYKEKYFKKDGLYIIEIEKQAKNIDDGVIEYLNEIGERYKEKVIELEEYECECE